MSLFCPPLFEEAVFKAKQAGLVKTGDTVVITAGVPLGVVGMLVFRAVLLIPDRVGLAAAFLLVCPYAVDFAVSAYQAYQNAHTSTEAEPVPGRAAR